ncbi:MAG TPA: hypothetical protein VGH42_11880 [Verrucomicrobiae bacterium]|jgi:tetratricopeptide (TPR) repeat protein
MNMILFINCKSFIEILRLGFVFILMFLGTRSAPADDFTNLLVNANGAYKERNYELSLEYYNKAIEIETNDPFAYLGRGSAYEHVKQFDRAENDFNQAIRIGLPEKEMQQAHKELDLFEQNKPYHADK